MLALGVLLLPADQVRAAPGVATELPDPPASVAHNPYASAPAELGFSSGSLWQVSAQDVRALASRQMPVLAVPELATPAPRMATVALPRESVELPRVTVRTVVNPSPVQADQAGNMAGLVKQLKAIFRDEGIPPELVWIAEVESRFDPLAESTSGALGMFQFMPDTAARFGLQVEPWYDERVSPEKSARAAAQYLRVLHRQFGSWPLALAAYNAGEGFIGRMLEKYTAHSFEDIAAHLPDQTRRYVPKVLETVENREGIAPAAIPPPTSAGRQS